jgi:hypothetical protein
MPPFNKVKKIMQSSFQNTLAPTQLSKPGHRQEGVVGPLPAALIDLYSEPHRGLRFALSRLLDLGAITDFERFDERELLSKEVERICSLFEHHMEHEEQFVHPALVSVNPAIEKILKEEHAEHRQQMKNLVSLSRSAIEQPDEGRRLYLSIARFALENFAHMELEETTVQRTLEEHFDWGTLRQIHTDLVSSITPELMVEFLRVMLPAMSARGRKAFLEAPRAALPADAFGGLVRAASEHLPPHARDELLKWAAAA